MGKKWTGSITVIGPDWATRKTKQSRSVDTFLDPTLDTGVPSARNDIAVPYLIGRRVIEGPNTIWNSVPRTTVTTVTKDTSDSDFRIGGIVNIGTGGDNNPDPKTMVSSISIGQLMQKTDATEVTVESVETRFDFAFGLCLGPGVRCLTVMDEDKNIIHKNPQDQETEDPDTNWVIDQWNDMNEIPKPKRGDTAKSLRFYSGSWDQPVDPTILKWEGPKRTPAFRGTSYAVFYDAIITQDNTVSLPYSFDVYRTPDPLGLGGDNRNSAKDVNVATALYDILTSRWGMLGVTPALIHKPSFVACGHALADEDNFCTVWMTQTSQAKSILGVLSDQAFGALRWNSSDKRLEFMLFRDDYVIDDLPLFNGDNLEDITSLQKDHWVTLPTSVQVDFSNRAKNYESMPAIVGLSKTNGETGGRVAKLNFETITSSKTALVVASREFARLASPLLTADLQANRDGASVLPGDVIAVEWPEIYPGKIPFRVTKTKEKGTLLDTTTISVEQAIFPILSTAYGPANDLAKISAEQVEAPGAVEAIIVPLFIARYSSPKFVPPIDSFTDDATYSFVAVREGNDSFQAKLHYDNSTLINVGFLNTIATLNGDLNRMVGYTSGEISSISLTLISGSERIKNNPKEKESWFKIGNELFRYETGMVVDGNYVLYNVQRGLVDTIAEDHSTGDEVLFFGSMENLVPRAYDTDEATLWFDIYGYNGKVLSPTATPLIFPTEQRANLPACPQNGMVSLTALSNSYPRPAGPQNVRIWWEKYYISWRSRDYLSTSFTARNANKPTAGTTYDVDLRVGATVAHLATGVTANEIETSIPVGFPMGLGQIEITAKNANGASFFKEFIAVNVTNAP